MEGGLAAGEVPVGLPGTANVPSPLTLTYLNSLHVQVLYVYVWAFQACVQMTTEWKNLISPWGYLSLLPVKT